MTSFSILYLKTKYDNNMNTTWGEIISDIALPNRDNDVTDYQSNAMRDKKYIEKKSKSVDNSYIIL